jgi:hypothetical protein
MLSQTYKLYSITSKFNSKRSVLARDSKVQQCGGMTCGVTLVLFKFYTNHIVH